MPTLPLCKKSMKCTESHIQLYPVYLICYHIKLEVREIMFVGIEWLQTDFCLFEKKNDLNEN